MSSGTVAGYFLQVVPTACLAGIIYLIIRLTVLKKRKAPPAWGAELLRLLFVCYLTGLVSLVILPANFWLYVYDGIFLGWWEGLGNIFRIGNVNLLPSVIKWLKGELSVGSWVRTMLIGNIAMFVPLGLLLPPVFGIEDRRRMLFFSAVIPLACETLQLFFGRSFDTDDLICNFLGILIGVAAAFAIQKLKRTVRGE